MSTTSRRSFLKATRAVAGCAAASRLEGERLRLPIGLQLYSVRDQLPKDFAGTARMFQEMLMLLASQ
jgi:hypothetical protein